MNYRLNKTGIALVALLVAGAIGIFAYTVATTPKGNEPATENIAATSTSPDESGRTLTAMHQYKDGIHTIAGTLEVPTPCHRLATEPFFVGTEREAVEIRFTTSTQDEMCAQVITEARYKTAFEGPENIRITGALDGEQINLNLVPVPQGQDLDTFEVFLKG